MAFYSKYKPILCITCVLLIIILNLYLLRQGLESKVIQKHYIMHYHRQDMEEIKTKLSALKSCQSKLVDTEMELSWNRQRVNELQLELKHLLTNRHKYLSQQPMIFAITPTYKRWTQKADLTRLCQTLMHVNNLKWIVIEDSTHKTSLVKNFLSSCSINTTHLNIKTSANLLDDSSTAKKNQTVKKIKKPRGIEQRNLAIKWLRQKYKPESVKGVVYFADDDNTYDLRVFEEMRLTEKVSVWPVGTAGGLKFEGPICSGDTVKHWYAYWAKDRKFQIDFAGFAVNIDIILNTRALILTTSKPGYVENDFLEQLVEFYDLEPKADSCRKVLVWHTRTEKPPMFYEDQLIKMGHPSNPKIEV